MIEEKVRFKAFPKNSEQWSWGYVAW